jgi:hypothetical protein
LLSGEGKSVAAYCINVLPTRAESVEASRRRRDLSTTSKMAVAFSSSFRNLPSQQQHATTSLQDAQTTTQPTAVPAATGRDLSFSNLASAITRGPDDSTTKDSCFSYAIDSYITGVRVHHQRSNRLLRCSRLLRWSCLLRQVGSCHLCQHFIHCHP